jgi:ubiquinone/menaquinone biosynthesis C-methylase UbiE
MIDQAFLDEASRMALDRGIRLLQGFRMGDTDASHVNVLLEIMQPMAGSSWLDIGSGFGEAARLMGDLRPDLNFTLVNNSRFQIENTPDEMIVEFGDMHALPFDHDEFDGAMFLYSLCQADDLVRVLSEAARVVRMGGQLFVFDYLRMVGDNGLTAQLLASKFYTREELDSAFLRVGWLAYDYKYPTGTDAVFRRMVDKNAMPIYERMFDDLVPVLINAVRYRS